MMMMMMINFINVSRPHSLGNAFYCFPNVAVGLALVLGVALHLVAKARNQDTLSSYPAQRVKEQSKRLLNRLASFS